VKLLIPEINELLQDEEVQVRNTAITVLIDICPYLSKGGFKGVECCCQASFLKLLRIFRVHQILF
jgi:hypothetical protein